MARLMLSDELWSKLQENMLQHRIYDKPNLRLMVEAILYRMRVGGPWRISFVDYVLAEQSTGYATQINLSYTRSEHNSMP
jgi:hypothetical protein